MEMKSLSVKIPGERIYLKKHSLDLAQVMFEYIEKDRKRLAMFLPWVDYIKSVEDEIIFINSTIQHWEDRTMFGYGIFLNDSNTYLGNIGTHAIAWQHNCTELGYWILGDYEGKGYMSEAVKLLENHLFESGFNRIEIRCSNFNSRSANVPINCGYTLEGSLRDNRKEQGQYCTTKIFGKLRSEWTKG